MAVEYSLYIAAYHEYLRVKASDTDVAPPSGPFGGSYRLVSGGDGAGWVLHPERHDLEAVCDGSGVGRQGVATRSSGVDCFVGEGEHTGATGSSSDETGGGGSQFSGVRGGAGGGCDGAKGEVKLEGVVDGSRGRNWARNREWKQAKKARKLRRVEEKEGCARVPAWRVGAAPLRSSAGVVTGGAFSLCTEDMQRELRESRARMLVEKNKTEAAEAAQRRRLVEARAKTRMVEEEVEKKRLELVASNKRLYEAQMSKLPVGFAETVVSLGLESVVGTPSLSSGSVSPDSSISVAELKRKDAAIEMLVAKVAELTAENCKVKEVVNEVYVSDGYAKEKSDSGSDVVGVGRCSDIRSVGKKKRMSSTERAKRNYLCLPVEGPGSGMDGHCRWD